MLMDLSVAIMQAVVSVAIMQLGSAAHMQVTVPVANMWVTIFIVIMQVTLSFIPMQVTVSSNNFIFLSLSDNLFIKLTRKYLKALYQVCISPN